jgi:hypothetical protein
MTTEQIIRWSTAGAVVGVAAVAAVASYDHAYALVRARGETGWIGRLVPLTVDGLIYASSMVLLDSARREVPVPALAGGCPAWASRRRWRRTWRPGWATARPAPPCSHVLDQGMRELLSGTITMCFWRRPRNGSRGATFFVLFE